MNPQINDCILKFALQNAVKFNGKANPGAVISKVIGEMPEVKSDMKGLNVEINKILSDIHKLSFEEQRAKLEEIAPVLLEKKEHKEKDLFAFLNINDGDKVTTAFPPEPSKYPHIGHAKALIMNYELAKRYKGTFYLRFEDTNPKLAKKEFYDIHLENYKWLGVTPDRVDYASDLMDKYYDFAKKLISESHAYVCFCDQETTKNNRFKGLVCDCRSKTITQNLDDWVSMFKAKEGTCVLRLKIDMQHQNTTMRDPTIMRIIDHPHPRFKNKYRVWPGYDFQNSVLDGVEETTHRLRSKEFEMRNELQRYIQRLLGYKETNIYEFARFNMVGVESQGRIIREKIASGDFVGWDDPRLTTLVALRRRGFLPQAIKDFVWSTGINKNEATLTWDDLCVHNRRLLDKSAKRFFFIDDPVKITIKGSPELDIKLKVHPENPGLGFREFITSDKFLLAKDDVEVLLEGELYRLMDCLNFVYKKKKGKFISTSVDDYKSSGKKIVHYLPDDKSNVKVQILMPDGSIKKGVAEKNISTLQVGDVIQFERFGFCRLDAVKKAYYSFWFTHK